MLNHAPLPGGAPYLSVAFKAWMLYLGLCLTLALVMAWDLLTSREQDMEAARQRTHATSVLVSEWLYAAFETSGALLSSMAGEIHLLNFPPPEGDPEAHARINQWLERHRSFLPHARTIALFDREGVMIHTSGDPQEIGYDISTQRHFLSLHAAPSLERQVSRTLWSHECERFLVTHAQALRDAEGRFAGLLGVRLDLGFFDHWLERIELTPGSTLTILDKEGRLLARRPRDDIPDFEARLGQPVGDGEVDPLIQDVSDTTHFAIVSPLDGIHRFYTAQAVRDLPFLVVAGEANYMIMASWWRKFLIFSLSWLVIAGLGLLVLRGYLRTLQYDQALQRSHRSLEDANRILSREVNERQEAERAIKCSEARFRALFDNSLSGVAVHDIILDGRGEPCDYVFTMANPAFEHHTGLKVADVLGRRATEVYPVPELPGLIRRFGQVALTGQATLFEQHLESVGEVFSVGAFQTGPGGFAVVIDNITARKRTEMDLRRSEEKYRFLVENGHDIIHLISSEGYFEFISPSSKALMGHDPESILGHHFSEFVHPEDLHICEQVFASVMQHGHHVQDIEYRVRHQDGHWRWHNSSALPSRDESGKITGYHGIARDITARKQAEEEIRALAFFDPLTQLPNRRLLTERLEATVSLCHHEHRHGALLFIDLDNFKILNDTLGHHLGDQLLMQAAGRIRGCVHESDTVARLGGDEFVVMLCLLSHHLQEATQQVEIVADKILTALNHPYLLNGQEHHTTASIGITLFDSEPVSVDELMKRADLAMYQAKAAGRNTMRLFDPGMQAWVAARAALEGDLRRALVDEQFLLYYQVMVDDDGQLAGAEALLRWQSPDRGLVPPGEFIALAEDTGLILPIGQWVLESVCAQLAQWARDPSLMHLQISANVSARQFRHPDFVPGVLRALNATGADPCRLKLEITESLLLEDVEEVIHKMQQLRALGITFALDDFGTGYSSLSYLKRLPLDDVKIDQSFVRDVLIDPNDAAIARTIVALAGTLGIRVIAEGVETREHWEWLSRIGCHSHQGYFFGRPGPVTVIQEIIPNWTPSNYRTNSFGSGS